MNNNNNKFITYKIIFIKDRINKKVRKSTIHLSCCDNTH